MTNSRPNLAQLQQWFQSVISHPLGVETGIASADAQRHHAASLENIEETITRSQALTSVERLAIYGNAYYLRLLECLREMFPLLVYTIEEDLFNDFAMGYLQQYPSQSYTLADLSNQFARFLEESRPAKENDDPDWSDLLIDIATLEWNIDQVFDGPGVETESLLTVEQVHQVPPERWADAKLIPVPCLRLVSFRYPVNDYYTNWRQDQKPAIPSPQDTSLALTRRNYIVRRFPLDRTQHTLLTALCEGQSLEAAIAIAAETVDDFSTFGDHLQNSFRLWSTAGFFLRIDLDE